MHHLRPLRDSRRPVEYSGSLLPTHIVHGVPNCERSRFSWAYASSYIDFRTLDIADWILCWSRAAFSRQDHGLDPCAQAKRDKPQRIDSAISLCELNYHHVEAVQDGSRAKGDLAPPASLILNLHFEDKIYIKALDYRTFSAWNKVDAVLQHMEKDGIAVQQLWDTADNMEVHSGDWNARVRPGWEVDVVCCDDKPLKAAAECDTDSDDDEAGAACGIIDGVCVASGEEEKQWWFSRWRERVERVVGDSEEEDDQESVDRMVMLGIILTALFVGSIILLPK